ncbi:efflux RND transporter periplasmic adaptor subunit [Pelomonas sp. SE-A7]|uniref:efflux RND transporter periplasmic adaptor subunit n=1 Tax=Pelomonas sp. SE-A7 TaxID=3054953 RepID=UPI00259C9769|nr:efflux RND transporter periplasmic adaptor subunit [Pelomonas sp. SE-A7]MDM4768027.1 efflux RND transporter periplasmic adaptor subunit [Pelomonas sp. SE-A7]
MTIRDTSATDQLLPQRSFAKKRGLWIGVAAVAVIGVTLAAPSAKRLFGADSSVQASRLALAQVKVAAMVRDVAGEGKVVAANSPTLYAGNPGTVTLKVQAGDAVKRGQVLMELHSPDLLARLNQERANADALKSEWLRAQADAHQQRAQATSGLETATIAHKTAQNDLQRQTQAYAAGATAGMQVDLARDSLARTEVALKQAKELLTLKEDALKFELAAKRQAWERQQLVVTDLQRQQDELSVRSPVDGQVGQLFVTDRMSVAKDAKLLTVIDLSALEVQMQVAESFARELQPGMTGEMTGSGQSWKGRVSSISPEVVNNEVAARLRFEGEQPEQLRQNQRLSVRVLLDRREQVLQLPRGAFVDEGGGRIAYVIQDGQAVRRQVRLGATSLSQVEVLEGLKPGETVVISGTEHFKGADRVTVSQ